MMVFEPPRLLNGESQELYRFLYDLTEKLNLMSEETSAEAIWTTTQKALQTPINPGGGAFSDAVSNDQIGALRTLIIGSADTMLRVTDTEFLTMSGRYVAKSEFGTYFENATVTIDGNAWGITQLYDYSASIDSIYGAYRQDMETYIKSGLLYYDSGTPVYGVGVGKIYDTTAMYGLTEDVAFEPGKTYYEYSGGVYSEYEGDTSGDPTALGLYEAVISQGSDHNVYSTFTADSIKFWEGGTELAYIKHNDLHFPNANILGGTIQIGTPSDPDDLYDPEHYPFSVDSDGNLTIGYYNNVLNDYPFKVTSGGALTATGATITGTLKAETGSQIGDFKFSNGAIHSEHMKSLTDTDSGESGVWVGTDGVGVRKEAANGTALAYAYLSTSDGKLHATGAVIDGNITATSLNVSNTTTGTLDCTLLTVSNLNAGAITAGTLSSAYIKLSGRMSVYATASSGSPSGYLGWFPGYDGVTGTVGIGMYVSSGGAVKATSSGANMIYTGSTTYGEVYVSSGAALKAARSGTSKTVSMQYDSDVTAFAFEPAIVGDSGTITLGGSNRRWKVVYADTAAINTSDRTQKNSISYDIDDYEVVFDELKPVKYKFNNGDSNRYHTGFIAQDIEDSLEKLGMSTLDLAAFIKSPYYSDEGEFEGYNYALRYEELIALNTLKIKKLEERIRALEGAN